MKIGAARKPANTRDLAQYDRLTLVMIPGADTPTCMDHIKAYISEREKYGKAHHLAVASWNKPDDLANFIFGLAGGDTKGLENVSAIADFKGDFLKRFKVQEADPAKDLPKREVLEEHPTLGIAPHRSVFYFIRGRFVGYAWEASNGLYEVTSCAKSLTFDWDKAAADLAEFDKKKAAEKAAQEVARRAAEEVEAARLSAAFAKDGSKADTAAVASAHVEVAAYKD